MLKKWISKFDSKYAKIAVYAIIAVVIAFLIIVILIALKPLAVKFGKIIVAILKPLIVGLMLAYILSPLAKKLDGFFTKRLGERKWIHTVSVIISLAALIGIIALVIGIIISIIAKQIAQFNFSDINDLANAFSSNIGSFLDELQGYLSKLGINTTKITSSFTNSVSNITSTASTIFFGIIFAVYFLIDGENISRYWKNAWKKTFPIKTVGKMREWAEDADRCFSGYIRGQVIDALIVGVVSTVVFLLIGMKFAVVLGLIVGFGNLIPYVGPLLGYAGVIIINLINWDPKMMLIGLIALAIIMFADGNIINPKLLAGSIKIHPLLVIASLIAGGAIGGLLGMLVAVPIGAFIKIRFDKWLAGRGTSKKKAVETTDKTTDTQ